MAQPPDPRLQIEIPTARSDAAPDADARADDGRWANRGVTPRADQGIGWVVVADEAIARILTTTEAPGTLDPVEALTDPAAHTKEGDLHVNDAGRRGGRVSREGGHGGPRSGAGSTSVTASAGPENRHLEAQPVVRRVGQVAPAVEGAARGPADMAAGCKAARQLARDDPDEPVPQLGREALQPA